MNNKEHETNSVLSDLSDDVPLQFHLSYDDSDENYEDELPYEIDFIRKLPTIDDYVDFDKLSYNDHYRKLGTDHILNKMPAGDGLHIPGWLDVIKNMASSISDSPLEEMIKLSVDNIYDRKDSNFFK